MTQPLAIVLYERLLPGSKLVNRLQDLGYRVLTVTAPGALVACAEQEKPMLAAADMVAARGGVAEAIAQLKKNPAPRPGQHPAYPDYQHGKRPVN